MAKETEAVTVRVSPALWRRLKVKAAEEGVTVSSLIEAGMVWVLGPPPDAIATVTGVAYRDHTGAMATASIEAFRDAGLSKQNPAVHPPKPVALTGGRRGGKQQALDRLEKAMVTGFLRSDEAVCAQCGEKWAFHQEGSSKHASKRGCPRFREPSWAT